MSDIDRSSHVVFVSRDRLIDVLTKLFIAHDIIVTRQRDSCCAYSRRPVLSRVTNSFFARRRTEKNNDRTFFKEKPNQTGLITQQKGLS